MSEAHADVKLGNGDAITVGTCSCGEIILYKSKDGAEDPAPLVVLAQEEAWNLSHNLYHAVERSKNAGFSKEYQESLKHMSDEEREESFRKRFESMEDGPAESSEGE